MHDWVVSTKQDAATGNALAETYTDVDGNTHTHDTAEYRLAKFKTEFEDYFNMHYALIYYVYTFFALMVDQRAKNMFLTYWGNTRQWYFYFYDNDTAFSINNEGNLVFDYYHEDTDQVDGANVYNGQLSTLWINFRQSFPDLIQETYQDLRSNSVLNYDELIDQFITHGSDKWSESIYNEDGDFKYISMLRTENDATNLPQIRGTGEEHLRYFIENRLNYCDSKWYAGDYPEDNAVVRIYTPVDENGVPLTDLAIPANANITVTPYSNMYAGVRYKANGTLMQERLEANETYTFVAPNETFNDTETAIYGASQLSSLGDLAPLYLGYIDVGAATKLVELKIGDGTEGYKNANLYHLAVGTNRLLKKIDIQNCDSPRFVQALVLTGCPNIEEVYAKGSSITGVELPDSGYLKILQLPATITNLTLKNQPYIEDLTIEGYENLKTITIENCPVIDSLDILDKAVNVERVRLTNVDWHYDDASILYELIDRDIAGIDENGVNTDIMWIDGKCHIETLTGNELLEIKTLYTYLDITYTTLTSQLIYMSEDGTEELHRETIYNGGDGTDPVANGIIETPTKESTAQYDYTFGGWSLKPNSEPNPNALKNVEANRNVYVAFNKTIRSYTVNFYNGTTLLETQTIEYGSDATYGGATPVHPTLPDYCEFTGWSPQPTNITGNVDCYAQWYDTREITDDWTTIAAACLDGTATDKYAIGAYKMLDIGATELPYDFIYSSSVVLNNEIHILGSSSGDSVTKHYKWNGEEWISVSTLPYAFYQGASVVCNDEIHILGGAGMASTKHYKWNGEEWISVSTLPYGYYVQSVVVFNNEIHILGSSSNDDSATNHYKWNGVEWVSVSTLPYQLYQGSSVVYNDEIHILGANINTNRKFHYKWNGRAWAHVSTLPFDVLNYPVVVLNNEIHILNGKDSASSTTNNHYKWNGVEWIKDTNFPCSAHQASACMLSDSLYILGGKYNPTAFYQYSSETSKWIGVGATETIPMEVVAHNHDELADGVNKWEKVGSTVWVGNTSDVSVVYHDSIHQFANADKKWHKKWDGSQWIDVGVTPINCAKSSVVVWNDEIHILGGSANKTAHYKWNDTDNVWTEVEILPYEFNGPNKAVVYNNEIHIFGMRSNNSHYKWDGTSWVQVSTLPISNYPYPLLHQGELCCMQNYVVYKYDGEQWVAITNSRTDLGSTQKIFEYQNEIHFITNVAHYKYSGEDWVVASDLREFYTPTITDTIVYQNEIYILKGVTGIGLGNIYKWSIPSFEELPISGNASNFYYNRLFIYNDELYITNKNSVWYKTRDGISFESTTEYVDSLLMQANNADAMCIIDNNVYFWIDSFNSSSEHFRKIYKYDLIERVSSYVCDFPNNAGGPKLLEYQGNLHIIGGNYVGAGNNHYIWDGSSWTCVEGYKGNSICIVYNGEIHSIGVKKHRKYDGTKWEEVGNTPCSFANIIAVVNNCIYTKDNASKDVYKYDGVKWSVVWCDNNHLDKTVYGHFVSFNNRLYSYGGLDNNSNMLYVLRNPRATLTFLAKNLLKDARPFTKINYTDVTKNDWINSSLREWCNNELFTELPSDLSQNIQSVVKLSSNITPSDNNSRVVNSSYDKIWIPSNEELGEVTIGYSIGCGNPYSVFTDNASRVRNDLSGEYRKYFTRNIGGYQYQCMVGYDGKIGSVLKSNPACPEIGFCI